MDFGIGSLIEKFEEYAGKRVVGALILVLIIATFALGLNMIWNLLLSPLLVFLQTPLMGMRLIELFVMASSIGLGIGGGLFVIAAVARWQKSRKLAKIIEQARATNDRAASLNEKVMSDHEESVAALERAQVFGKKGEALMQLIGELANEMLALSDEIPAEKIARLHNALDTAVREQKEISDRPGD